MSVLRTALRISKATTTLKTTTFPCKFWRPVTTSTFSTKKGNLPPEEEELNEPIKFSTSPAAKWKAKASRTGEREPRLWYEPYVIIGSFVVFTVYFLILREESDIDQEFTKSLYSRIQGLEEHQLRLALEYNKEGSLDAANIEARLSELQEEKREK